MKEFEIGDTVINLESSDYLVIVDYFVTKDNTNIYLCSNYIWYDEKILSLVDYNIIKKINSGEKLTLSDFGREEDVIDSIKESLTDSEATKAWLDWLNSENEKWDKENKPTIFNFFNIFKKEKPGRFDGMF
jgi:hypothetical protein